jgi:hypothetical protein
VHVPIPAVSIPATTIRPSAPVSPSLGPKVSDEARKAHAKEVADAGTRSAEALAREMNKPRQGAWGGGGAVVDPNAGCTTAGERVMDHVRDRLVAPSGAKFGEPMVSYKVDQSKNQIIYEVVGQVDSQNKLGVNLRSTYHGTVIYEVSGMNNARSGPHEEFRVEGLTID